MTGKFSMTRFLIAFYLILAVLLTTVGVLGPTNISDKPKNNNEDNEQSRPTVSIPGSKRVAFTFDDGPQAPAEDLDEGYYPYTTYVLDKLESLKMRATFFVLGERAKTYPNAISRAVSLGCEIGSHTYDHSVQFSADTPDEQIKSILKSASDAIAASGAPAPKLFRPVGGSVTPEQLEVIHNEGYITVGWSVDSEDWDGRPTTGDKFSDDPERNAKYEAFVNERVETMYAQIKDGDIVLMHDISMSSVDIFIRLADKLVADGFELVTVSEMLEDAIKDGGEPVMYISKDESIDGMN